MASVELINVEKSYGTVAAIRDVSLAIADREFVVFVGPSGCGKSTLLRMIAGLEAIDRGELRIGGRSMNAVPAADRGIAMVFQSYALYPHMTVAENMGFAVKMAGLGRPEVEQRVRRAAAILQIEELLGRKPKALSGGQRQRVAIDRAITRSPDVFLFDEPLSNLDASLRAQMRIELAKLHGELNATMIFVTHDQVEAMTLADRIVVLNWGRIEQAGTPLELYERPANQFVAGFLGQPRINLIPFRPVAEGVRILADLGRPGRIALDRVPGGIAIGQPHVLGFRPDTIRVQPEGTGKGIAARVELVENLGSERVLHARIEGIEGVVTSTHPAIPPLGRGAPCEIVFGTESALVFDAQGQTLPQTPR